MNVRRPKIASNSALEDGNSKNFLALKRARGIVSKSEMHFLQPYFMKSPENSVRNYKIPGLSFPISSESAATQSLTVYLLIKY